ncbi:myristoyl-protein N-myristoyltransferase domain-containing protein [Cryptosporidium andersoni]|uniref:Glycylpeptide N-tetradecanoyltransferase n=1 Tax=Cryptosporidium andersoni TaxID=117008 RepID=A0A1J4MZG9_9CRYT|nr:myristoyl-protein N-myristoyltransferase domain-containing protein [Cryptosporidium andersoni]
MRDTYGDHSTTKFSEDMKDRNLGHQQTFQSDNRSKADIINIANQSSRKQIQSMLQEMSICGLFNRMKPQSKEHKFWNTQPVIQNNEKIEKFGPIELEPNFFRREPYKLPNGYIWHSCNLSNVDTKDFQDVYQLLADFYIEDDDSQFRFLYSKEFLHWALCIPGYYEDWHLGIKLEENNKLVAFISAIPNKVRIHNSKLLVVIVNYLCIHKKLRSKRLAPVLVKEITRRVRCRGIFQAIYTCGKDLTMPFAACQYWHRSLNPKKLYEIGFSQLTRNMTISRAIKLYRVPSDHVLSGFRPATIDDAPQILKLFEEYHYKYKDISDDKYNNLIDYDTINHDISLATKAYDTIKDTSFGDKLIIHPIFDLEMIKHIFINIPEVITSYVRVNHEGNITDLFSFFCINSTVLNNPRHKLFKAAYGFYNIANTCTITELYNEALIIAYKQKYDVFNVLDIHNNSEILDSLKFVRGSGMLRYYIFNWQVPLLSSKNIYIYLF